MTKRAPDQEFTNPRACLHNNWRMKEEGAQPKGKHPCKKGERPSVKFSVHRYTLHVLGQGKINITEQLRLRDKILSAVICE
jgi:hypothetical protein